MQGLLPMIATSELAAAGRSRAAGEPGCRAHTNRAGWSTGDGVWRLPQEAGKVSNNGLLHPRDAPNALSMGERGTIARGKPGCGGYDRGLSSDVAPIDVLVS